jgi:hypothetical protein
LLEASGTSWGLSKNIFLAFYPTRNAGGRQKTPKPRIFFGLSRPNPALDQVAAVSLLEDVCTDRLGRLSSYLEKHSQRFPALEACSAHVTQATFALNNRDYGQSLGLIWETYRLITTLGAINPDLPPLSLLAERMQGAEQARH